MTIAVLKKLCSAIPWCEPEILEQRGPEVKRKNPTEQDRLFGKKCPPTFRATRT
jgi:hypothetical protein